MEIQTCKKGLCPTKTDWSLLKAWIVTSTDKKYMSEKNRQANMAAYIMDKIKQNRASKDVITFSCSTWVQTVLLKKNSVHLASTRWYHLLGPSSFLMTESPCVAWRDQNFHQSLVQAWLSLYIKTISQRWLDFTFEKHNHTIFGDCSLRLSRGLDAGRNPSTGKVALSGSSLWEVMYHRTLGITCFGYIRIGVYFLVAYLFHSWNISIIFVATQNQKLGDRKKCCSSVSTL